MECTLKKGSYVLGSNHCMGVQIGLESVGLKADLRNGPVMRCITKAGIQQALLT